MKFTTILATLSFAAVSVLGAPAESPNGNLLTRQNSGCYPFEAPDCCINYAVCQCANGWVYEFNTDNYNAGGNGCNPPWGYLGTSNTQLPGYCC
ncbi:hypothetical protein NA56DRAFT_746575 [Hyaloscypha hepaticicola]|uniref:Uncharacterized protein n=1 Tax=Hyaloscypha hepaticicola TaxID=2082293 RepID=A0A2J6QBA6_9HELO|nr:hypothetical protein NA56DRAFT_746575 [Hyaloscypha hepaticicola]